jgi:CopA family copper-resistance protein
MRQLYLTMSALLCNLSFTFSQQIPSNDTTLELQPSEAAEQRGMPARSGKMVEYHLYVKDSTVNFTGKKRTAIAINGQIPAPTLYFTEGDTAKIYVHNLKNEEVSIHWHGILLPNRDDGVPYLTTAPIKAGATHLFQFPIIQTGTFWYHSHSGLQEQSGLYGPLVMFKANEKKGPEEVLQLSDWSDIKPKEVLRLLKRGTDIFEIKKNAVQSWGEALMKGHLGDKFKFEWIRMPGVDLTDVFYPAYLMHGLPQRSYPQYRKGDSVRLRIVNGSAATYFWLQFAGGKMKVLAADGNDVEPVEVDKLLIATAETYDVLITIPDSGRYEFRATAQDIKGTASAFFGSGQLHETRDIPPMDYFKAMGEMNRMMSQMRNRGMKMTMGLKMKQSGKPSPPVNKLIGPEKPMEMDMPHGEHEKKMNMKMSDTMPMKPMMMQQMSMMKKMKLTGFDMPPGNENAKVLSYDDLKIDTSTALPPDRPWREIHLTLSGSMLRYVWSINGKTFSKLDEKIKIHKGENVRIYFMNATMMEHPMHLHGHFFRVVNDKGNHAPMKHTFNINPMGMSIIEFAATEQKDWFLHCHTLYHMMSGMATVVSYEGTKSDIQEKFAPGLRKFQKEHGSRTFFWGSAQLHSQGNFANLTFSGLNWQIMERWAMKWKGDYESETNLMYFLDKRKFLAAYIGADNRFTRAEKDKNGAMVKPSDRSNLAVAGISYLLPLFVMVDGRVDHHGNFRLQFSRRDFPLTKRLRLDGQWNTDKEYEVGMRYVITKNFSLSGNYDSDYKWGAGITLMY